MRTAKPVVSSSDSTTIPARFKEMHARMYERQTEWSHTNEDRSPVFRGYAEDLGLDLAACEAAIADPATMERVNADKEDGMALNVEGTPTFFRERRLTYVLAWVVLPKVSCSLISQSRAGGDGAGHR